MAPTIDEVLKTLPCEHFFHSDCLKQVNSTIKPMVADDGRWPMIADQYIVILSCQGRLLVLHALRVAPPRLVVE
jgi:hypothetical protein